MSTFKVSRQDSSQVELLPKKDSLCQKMGRVPRAALQLYRDNPEKALFMQRACASASRIGVIVSEVSANQALGVAPGFFMIYHDACRVKKHIAMTSTAIKAGMVAETLFSTIRGIDALGDGVGNVGKSVVSITQLAGVANLAVLSFIFTVILPHFLFTTSLIGCTGEIWSLIRLSCAYKQLSKKRGKNDFFSLVNTLEFLKGPKQSDHIDRETRKNINKVREEIHKTHHFRSEKSYHGIKQRIEELFKSLNPIYNTTIAGNAKFFIQDPDLKKSLEPSIQILIDALNANNDPQSSFAQMIALYDILEKSLKVNAVPGVTDGFLKEVITHKKQLQPLIKEFCLRAGDLVDECQSELRRNIMNQIIGLLCAILGAVASCMLIDSPHSVHSVEIANILLLTASVTHMCLILFDSLVSQKRYRALEERLMPKRHLPHI